MRHILYWLGLVDLVWVEQDDYIYLRIVRHGTNGTKYAYGKFGLLMYGELNILNADGTCTATGDGAFATHWYNSRPVTVQETLYRNTSIWRRK